MKTLTIARKMLFEMLREPLLAGLLLLFPATLVAFYYFAFRETDAGLATYLSLLVINDDAGVFDHATLGVHRHDRAVVDQDDVGFIHACARSSTHPSEAAALQAIPANGPSDARTVAGSDADRTPPSCARLPSAPTP